ncbi:MAG: STAS/SEC14 domain-containing protein [Patescibacteria group bacterium]
MYDILTESNGKNVGVKVVGRITKEDEDKLIERVNQVVAEHGKINVLFDFTDFTSAELKAEIEDFQWLQAHKDKIIKMAAVGSKKYEKMCAEFVKLIFHGDYKYFEESQLLEAWAWLKE